MAKDSVPEMFIDDADRPATRREVVDYVTKVMLAERVRVARILMDSPNLEVAAEAIADSYLNPETFGMD